MWAEKEIGDSMSYGLEKVSQLAQGEFDHDITLLKTKLHNVRIIFDWHWIVGCCIALLAAISSNLGLNLQRLSHLENDYVDPFATREYTTSTYFPVLVIYPARDHAVTLCVSLSAAQKVLSTCNHVYNSTVTMVCTQFLLLRTPSTHIRCVHVKVQLYSCTKYNICTHNELCKCGGGGDG